MKAWRLVGIGLGVTTSACLVKFNDYPEYEVDSGATADASSSTSTTGKGSGGSTASSSDNGSKSSSSSSSGGAGGSSSSSGGSGGQGGGGVNSTDANTASGGSATSSGSGGDSSSTSNGGSPATSTSVSNETTTTSGGGNGGSGGAIDTCSGADVTCSACNNFDCVYASYCCADVSFFAAETAPEYVEMPELITSYDEQNSVTLAAQFTGNSQMAAIAYALDYYMNMNYSLSISASVSGGWTMTVSLEDSSTDSGCVYTTGNVLDAFDVPDNCWGDFDGYLLYPYDFSFNQINVRIESMSSGAGSGSLSISGMTLQ